VKFHLLAVGEKMPAWVTEGYREYSQRLPGHLSLILKEQPVAHRGKNPDIERLKRDEGKRMLAAIPAGARAVALEIGGKPWSTEELARRMQGWMQSGGDVALMVGGPDGLAPECLARADERWSLGPMTLPHPLVRVVVAEQLYRAWSILNNHPYHRA
jgi:23S rRNA (pseudouridine1915-N3)-methyltransferase